MKNQRFVLDLCIILFNQKSVMKKFIFLCVFILSAINFVSAQEEQEQKEERKMPTPKEMADRETVRYKKDLALTDDQTAKVAAINLKYGEEFRIIFEEAKASGDFSTVRNRMEGVLMAKNNEIKPLLSTEQKVKFDKLVKKMKREAENGGSKPMQMGGGRRGGMGGMGGGGMGRGY